jgi:hypothetical protein
MRSAQVRAGSGLRMSEWLESPDSDFEFDAYIDTYGESS